MDDGMGGNYESMVGEYSPFMMPSFTAYALTRGLTYRFRYRARNCIGWGPFSNDAYFLAASEPVAPPMPQLVSTSSKTVVLNLFPTKDNGGSVVTSYNLYRNLGTDGTAF